MHWQCRDRKLNLDQRPLIMGILNVTPDSFSDGGRFLSAEIALSHARDMLAAGADIIDVGGESTRPGAAPVDANTEMSRILPIIETLAAETGAAISVDTSKVTVAREAVRLGACIINDISALTADPAMAGFVRESGAGVVLMHMQGNPRTMQNAPIYTNVVEDIFAWLSARIYAAKTAGISTASIAADPGIGFGKNVAHNIELIARLDRFTALGHPLLVGLSRKRFIGALTGTTETETRLAGSLAALTAAVLHGAQILRVHDVAESAQAARIAAAIRTPALVQSLMESAA